MRLLLLVYPSLLIHDLAMHILLVHVLLLLINTRHMHPMSTEILLLLHLSRRHRLLNHHATATA